VGEDYQIIGLFGAGGMGKVYKVRNTIGDRIDALKVLLPDLAEDSELADCFIREIGLQASLNHIDRAGLRAEFRLENQFLVVMEFVEGTTLDERSKVGVKVGDHLGVFRQGRQIKDPATGKVLKTIESKLGDVTVTEVDDSSSTGTYSGQPPKVGDTVRNSQ